MKKSNLFMILSASIISVHCFAQNGLKKITIDEISDTTFGIYSYYFDPIYNVFFKNIFSSSNSKCLFTKEISSENRNRIIEYYNKDTVLIASGHWFSGFPNGVFKIYCESLLFPYCKSNDIQKNPVREIVYYKGRIIEDIFYNNDGQIQTLDIKSYLFKEKHVQ